MSFKMDMNGDVKKSFDNIWAKESSYMKPVSLRFGGVAGLKNKIIATGLCKRPCEAREENVFCEVIGQIDTEYLSASTLFVGQVPSHLSSCSMDGSMCAKIHPLKQGDKTSNIVEIWKNNVLIKTINLSGNQYHTNIYTEEAFSSVEWSSDNNKLFYIAESAQIRPSKYDMNQFKFHQNFGEKLTGVTCPDIFCLDINTNIVSKVFEKPSNLFPSKIAARNQDLYFLAYAIDALPQGVLYCTNQPQHLFLLKGLNSLVRLTQFDRVIESFTVHSHLPLCFVLDRQVGGCHRTAVNLTLISLETYDTTTVLTEIYALPFVRDCWIGGGTDVGVLINIISGKKNALSLSAALKVDGEWSLYDVDTEKNFDYNLLALTSVKKANGDISYIIACSRSNSFHPWSIDILKTTFMVSRANPVVLIEEVQMYAPEYTKSGTSSITMYFFDKDRNLGNENNCEFSGVLLYEKCPEKRDHRLIVKPHGGPHSISTIEYNRMVSVLIKMGFMVFLVNYRGSLGYTEAIRKSLLGKIGQQDVEDVHISTCVVSNIMGISSSNVHCLGGSHGGFISAHLAGRYPDCYQSCILINPVIDLPSMHKSDIPEWRFAEMGMAYSESRSYTDDELLKMYHNSPIIHAHSITCPVLLLLGDQDKRVPMHQGLILYRILRAKSNPISVHIYSDGHALDSVFAERSCVLEIFNFLSKYSKKLFN